MNVTGVVPVHTAVQEVEVRKQEIQNSNAQEDVGKKEGVGVVDEPGREGAR